MIAIVTDTDVITLQEAPATSDYGVMSARISRTATLDGGVVMVNSGFSHGDRTMKFVLDNVGEDTEAALQSVVTTSLLVNLICPEGVFEGYVSDVKTVFGAMTITFMINQKLS